MIVFKDQMGKAKHNTYQEIVLVPAQLFQKSTKSPSVFGSQGGFGPKGGGKARNMFWSY